MSRGSQGRLRWRRRCWGKHGLMGVWIGAEELSSVANNLLERIHNQCLQLTEFWSVTCRVDVTTVVGVLVALGWLRLGNLKRPEVAKTA